MLGGREFTGTDSNRERAGERDIDRGKREREGRRVRRKTKSEKTRKEENCGLGARKGASISGKVLVYPEKNSISQKHNRKKNLKKIQYILLP